MSTSTREILRRVVSAPDYTELEDMAKWASPQHSKGEVNRAGTVLAEGSLFVGLPPIDRAEVLSTINNWRSSHGYPQHIAKITLQNRAKKIDERALYAHNASARNSNRSARYWSYRKWEWQRR